MLKIGSVIRETYRITAPLARGGMGEIFCAVHLDSGRELVIKTLLTSLRDRQDLIALFFEEAELTLRLAHPRIVRALDYGFEGPDCFLAMEKLEGATLGALMAGAHERGRGLAVPAVLAVGIQLCEALDHGAHALCPDGLPLELVHRDLSPFNLFVTRQGSLKLLDFGIARMRGASRHRQMPSMKGKPTYRSPEMVRGEHVDARSDLFSAGIVLWEALAGRKLFRSHPPEEVASRILSGPLPRVTEVVSDVPPAVAAVLAQALERDPELRFQSAAQMREALLRVFRDHCSERLHRVLRHAVAFHPS